MYHFEETRVDFRISDPTTWRRTIIECHLMTKAQREKRRKRAGVMWTTNASTTKPDPQPDLARSTTYEH